MDNVLFRLVDKFWARYISIPIVIIISILSCSFAMPDKFEDFAIKHISIIIFVFIANVTYVIYCLRANQLPKAKGKKWTVLFVIDTESDQLFQDIQKKLVSSFRELINEDTVHNFDALCTKKERVKNSNLSRENDAKLLLEKTGCIFMVEVKYRVDSITNAENFEMQIRYGVVHREFEKTLKMLLQNDMNNLCIPIRKRRFTKTQLLEEFNFTTQSLTIICKYILGLVLLFSGEFQLGYSLFKSIYFSLKHNHPDLIPTGFEKIVVDRIYSACLAIVAKKLEDFYLDKNLLLLDEMNEKLEEANSIVPNTYRFFLNKAYYYMAKLSDVQNAKRCISKCKELKEGDDWKYSDAFLAAYSNYPPMSIYRKYSQALKCEQDLPQIINFIDYFIDREPERISLHLAVGLLYNEIDKILAKQHFMKFLSTNNDGRIREILQGVMKKYPNETESME